MEGIKKRVLFLFYFIIFFESSKKPLDPLMDRSTAVFPCVMLTKEADSPAPSTSSIPPLSVEWRGSPLPSKFGGSQTLPCLLGALCSLCIACLWGGGGIGGGGGRGCFFLPAAPLSCSCRASRFLPWDNGAHVPCRDNGIKFRTDFCPPPIPSTLGPFSR